jgi:glycosyltransferase involved in cell wall biosynthesis
MNVLILGSKEYPLGSNKGEDPSPSGGMEKYIEELVHELNKYVNITIITRKFRDVKAHEEEKNISIYRVSWIRGFFLRNPSFNLMSFFRALKINFDIIISNGEIANFFGLILSKINKKPVIMVSHGLASEQPQYNYIIRKIFNSIDRLTLKKANLVITHSPYQLEKDIKYKLILPGFNKKILKKDTSVKKEFEIKGKVIVFTGRLIKVKGIEYLLRALQLLKSQYTCFIVGDGPQRNELEKLAKKLDVNVIFTGFRGDVNRFLSIADVFVLPSISESLNYSMLEAAYMKVPIVVTDLDIIPKDSAIVVHKKNTKEIAIAINTIFTNKKLREKIIKNAKRFSNGFEWEKTAKEYFNVIKNITR